MSEPAHAAADFEDLGLRLDEEPLGPAGVVVTATGELDIATAPLVRDRLIAAIDAGKRDVVLDLGPVTFMDSVALGALVRGAKRLRSHGGTCVVVADDPRILRVFQITGLDRMFGIERTLAEGVDRLVGRIVRA
jgi:anti-sigma B factor antagonist